MDLGDHFRTIWDRRWYVLVMSVLVSAVVFAWSSSRPNVFRTDLILSVDSGRAATGGPTEQYLAFLAGRYARVAITSPVLQDAATRSGLLISGSEAAGHISVKPSDGAFINVAVTGPSTDATVALARALADALVAAVGAQHARTVDDLVAPLQKERERLQREFEATPANTAAQAVLQSQLEAVVRSENEGRLLPEDRLVPISEGTPPVPVSPRPSKDAYFALLAAVVINAELVVLFSSFRGPPLTGPRRIDIGPQDRPMEGQEIA